MSRDLQIDRTGLEHFHPVVAEWFGQVFDRPTPAQAKAWPAIAAGDNTLLLAPTGSGKTLAAFLIAIDRIMFAGPAGSATTEAPSRVGVLYISPLKALGVDVERNLRAPIAGVRAVAERRGEAHRVPDVAVRSGDTPMQQRARLLRHPPDILITTPESLYLILTSRARQTLVDVDTVIIDEIHSVVGNKRGAHLFVSLERLERLRRLHNGEAPAMQRIGLSATQRPLQEISRLLGGARVTTDPEPLPVPRTVTTIQAGRNRPLDVRIEVPVEDMARLAEQQADTGPAAAGPSRPSIWPSIHPRLIELIRAHRSTMIFVNSRRLAERLAASVNELADEELALAHHGSVAREKRLQIEDRLKRGQLPAIIATSSLELGIDMGAVDLVIQIEAPPSIASGIQRIGRSGHHIDAISKGIVFPKFRGDLLACSAAAGRMMRGEVEETFYPRNPLDVLAQQIVAMVAMGPMAVDEVLATVRGAAPFMELARTPFEKVLDLLAGRYPSDEFAELRPRLTWDRLAGTVSPRRGSQRLAVLNAGTIPDRGLYGVFLADGSDSRPVQRGPEPPMGTAGSRSASGGAGRRVGELDEEMVFETRAGDVFLLGASSWRVVEITGDRVLVQPAPGEPGRMPFWRGDGVGRPLEFGKAIGELTRRLLGMAPDVAVSELIEKHALERRAARNLMSYLHEQQEATGEAPNDKTVVMECFVDEIGDWRVAVLTPFGARVHAPWATAVAARIGEEFADSPDLMWTDDGIMFRLPQSDVLPPLEWFLPASADIDELVTRQLASTALFAARFRENAARALLLPRRQPGRRTPLWLQRRRAADLLSVASRYPDFPILLETYRECLRDVFDIAGLKRILRDIEQRAVCVRQVETSSASPFASSLMFSYVGNFIYDGDAPLAERRAATLALDHSQLQELLGDVGLRELIDADVVDALAMELQRLDGRFPMRDADELHDLLLQLGDLSRDEIHTRGVPALHNAEANAPHVPAGDDAESAHRVPLTKVDEWLDELQRQRRIIKASIASEIRFIAAEDAARYRDALGVVPPPGLPHALLESVPDPWRDLVSRYARTHVPFAAQDVAGRLGTALNPIQRVLDQLVADGRLLEGEFLPGGHGREWCDRQVLRKLKRRSIARLRQDVEPVDPETLGRFLPRWQGLHRPRKGLDGLLDVVEQLQGAAIAVSDLEDRVLPGRVDAYRPSDLDELCAAGEIVWRGVERLGSWDGRIALYLTDHLKLLLPATTPLEHSQAESVRQLLDARGALFFDDMLRATGMFRGDLLAVLWDLVWNGELTNDTLAPLRALRERSISRRRGPRRRWRRFRSRRVSGNPGSEGRWSLVELPAHDRATVTERQMAVARQLLDRYGVVTREQVSREGIQGGFAGLYPVFNSLEDAGRVRRGYFIDGLGASQFALPGAEDRLRDCQSVADSDKEVCMLAATDPANPYGSALAWPKATSVAGLRPARTAGACVILYGGQLIGYVSRTGQQLLTFPPLDEPERSQALAALVATLKSQASAQRPVFLGKIDGQPACDSQLAEHLQEAGFVVTSRGLLHRRIPA